MGLYDKLFLTHASLTTLSSSIVLFAYLRGDTPVLLPFLAFGVFSAINMCVCYNAIEGLGTTRDGV